MNTCVLSVLFTVATMPILEVHTNVAREKVTPGVLSGLSKMVSEMLGISESVRLPLLVIWSFAVVHYDDNFLFWG
ncbi:hypothetical protein E2C01_094364 [Portunus trituberculatus]|uniref:Uncharacterized protein n=1 Tax=Portunus trituberculatus TaxID=210409 RepID=A0A5B7JS91_PORTR|nr:hypothetical protein [Portunus trituberculatus]